MTISNIYYGNMLIGIFISLGILPGYSYIIVAGYRHREKYFMVQERRVIFIVILLGILFYVDNRYWSAAGIAYPILIFCYISFDMKSCIFLVDWH